MEDLVVDLMNNAAITQQRLFNQGLATIRFANPADVVRQLGAVQAQDYAGAKWALGQRLKAATDSTLDKAFNDGSILRTHLLRPTWHFVSPEDIRWLLQLTAPRAHAVNAFMYRQSELDSAIFKRSYNILEKALRGNQYHTRNELGVFLARAGIPAGGLRLTYIVMSAELDGIICSGPRKGKQFTYALLEERAPQVKSISRDEVLAELMKRYFRTRGPATVQDFSWWSGLTLSDAKKGIEMLQAEFESEVVNGQNYWFSESKLIKKEKSPTAHLLPNYDEYFIGFKDRSAIGDVAGQANISSNDPSFLAHIIILDGQVVGGWKRTLEKNKVLVETSLITTLTKAEMEAITNEAERFGKFLGLPVSLTHKEHTHEQRKTRSL